MFSSSKILRGTRAFAALAATLALSACLENTGVAVKKGATLSKTQTNCLAPDATAVRNVASRLAASAVEVGRDFCEKPTGYTCTVRKFSPSIPNGRSTIEERAHVAELGGDFAVKLESHAYNTREASRAPGVSKEASLLGGDYNRSEYVCHQHDLKDGDVFLATGEGESLNDALAAAYAKCSGVAPRLTAVK